MNMISVNLNFALKVFDWAALPWAISQNNGSGNTCCRKFEKEDP